MIFESHAHILSHKYDEDRDEVLKRAYEKGVSALLNVSDDMTSSFGAIELSKKHPRVFSAVGVHPHNAKDFKDQDIHDLEKLARDEKTLAIGEIGLDYYYDFSDRDIQMRAFLQQIDLALNLDLPIIVHDREAHKDTIDTLKGFEGKIKGVMHCYSGSGESAKILVNLGLYISFAGVITFKNARKTIEALEAVPLDRLLIETDSPYLTPEPFRGRRNEPKNLEYIGRKMAEVKNVSYETLVNTIWENSFNLFEKARPFKKELEKSQ